MRILVLGGGFGGVTTVRHLERVLRHRPDIEITLVSRENFFVLTPLLFEACTGRLELRHCAQPIRSVLTRTRFIEATVESVAPASGSTFSLLPTDNATGNFTKITQRVTVRIKIPAEEAAKGLLRPGLSVEAEIDSRTGNGQVATN